MTTATKGLAGSLRSLLTEGLPPAWKSSGERDPRRWRIAVLVALLTCCVYLALIVTTDNTNLGTTNGLWKSIDVAAWAHGKRGAIDTGGFLYLRTYGMLTRLIPDAWLRYGTAPPDVTFRKMAALNALFGGIASGAVWLFASVFTRSRRAAFVVVLAHAGAAFVILNSINSEDIIPAYAFFVIAAALLFEFLDSGKVWFGLAAAVSLSFATLFHWTVMAPALAGFGGAFALLALYERRFLAIGAAWLFAFLCALQALILAAFPAMHVPVWYVVLPAKASAAGWIGLRSEKLLFLLAGIGNYFLGGENVADYHAVFTGPDRICVIVSCAFVLIAAGACCAALLRRSAVREEKCVAAFAIFLFLAGQAGNFYSQPQDPQMQLPPMFAAIAGFGLVVRRLRMRPVALYGVMALLLANAFWNVKLMRADAKADGRSIALVQELERLFPREHTLMVCHGFEGWTTWQYILLWPGNQEGRLDRTLELARPFTIVRNNTARQAADTISARIDQALANHLRVVAAVLWTEPPGEFAGSLATVTSLSEAAEYERILRSRYHAGQRWRTAAGEIVELTPSK